MTSEKAERLAALQPAEQMALIAALTQQVADGMAETFGLRCQNAKLEIQHKRSRNGRPFNLCVYCGGPALGLACAAHSDVLAVDEHYAP